MNLSTTTIYATFFVDHDIYTGHPKSFQARIYTSVKRTSFTNSNKSLADMMSL